MNVLLVITNISGFHEVPYSFGISSIASYIKNKGYNVKILSIREENEFNKLIEEVNSFNPTVVGFTSVSSQYNCVKKLAKLIKDVNEKIIIVVGGVHVTLYPDALLETTDIDGIFVGESELAFSDFLDKINEGKDYRDTNNFAYRKYGRVIINTLTPLIRHLDILPYPIKDSLFEEFIEINGYAPFLFSRGCPYLCSYCSNHALAKRYGMSHNTLRYRSVDSCINEIKDALEKYKFDTVWFLDDTFGLDKKWGKEFCEKYKREINIKFICLLRPNVVDEEFIKLLKAARCYRILFGIESGNEYVRNTIMNRNISNEQIIMVFSLCRKYGIETCAFNIIGVPGETEDMLGDTIKLNRKIRPTDSGVSIYYPYKGTVLGDYSFSKGLVNQKMYEDFSNERRDTVLNYPEKYKEKLRYYYENWEILIYPYKINKRIIKKRIIALFGENSIVTNILRKIKKNF
ncbi:MAG: radical SAM protein [Candidatus Altiarchaeota archaeon]